MRYILVFFTITLFSCKATQRSSKLEHSYNILNGSIHDVIEIEEGTVILLDPRTVNLKDKLDPDFFDKDFLVNTYGKGGVIGVEPEKVMALIEKTDFENLKIPRSRNGSFDIKRFDFPVKPPDNVENFPKRAIYRISEPILFNNNDYFVIYYEYYCGIECGQGNLKVFIKIEGIWVEHIKLPIWIS